jgi:hypothetical protein
MIQFFAPNRLSGSSDLALGAWIPGFISSIVLPPPCALGYNLPERLLRAMVRRPLERTIMDEQAGADSRLGKSRSSDPLVTERSEADLARDKGKGLRGTAHG